MVSHDNGTMKSVFLGDKESVEDQNENDRNNVECFSIDNIEENEFDLSRVWSLKNFNNEMDQVYKEVFRVLKEDAFIAVLTGDIRQGGWKAPLGVMNTIQLDRVGFEFFDFIIKVTDNAISMRRPKVIKRALEENKTVTIHEYVIVARKKRGNKRKMGLQLPWEQEEV